MGECVSDCELAMVVIVGVAPAVVTAVTLRECDLDRISSGEFFQHNFVSQHIAACFPSQPVSTHLPRQPRLA